MRHQKRINHLSRTKAHRKAMLSNMASSLIKGKRINTTLPKARELRKYVEPLITKSKNDTMHSRRMVFRYLQDKEAVNELFREISVKIADRPGGYTRILKTGNRLGDNAEMCIIELVDYNEAMLKAKEEKKKSTGKKRTRRGRRRSGKSKSAGQIPAESETEENQTEETKTEEEKQEEGTAEKEQSAEGEEQKNTGEQKNTEDQNNTEDNAEGKSGEGKQ